MSDSSIAPSSRNHSVAGSDSNTLDPPATTAGTPDPTKASRTVFAWLFVRTRTAMSPGPTVSRLS